MLPLLIGAVVVVVVLIIIDVARSGPSVPGPTGTCVLIRRIILPDICSCTAVGGATCPPATTRPYAFFWTQAASCVTPTLGCVKLG